MTWNEFKDHVDMIIQNRQANGDPRVTCIEISVPDEVKKPSETNHQEPLVTKVNLQIKYPPSWCLYENEGAKNN